MSATTWQLRTGQAVNLHFGFCQRNLWQKKPHNNLDWKFSESVQQLTHNIPTPNYTQASLDITTDVFLSLTIQIPCHSDSCQLTAGCSTHCPKQLSEQFSSSILAREQKDKDPLSLFWRLPCWGSAGFPSLPHTWIRATTKSADPAAKHRLTLGAERPQRRHHHETACLWAGGCPTTIEVGQKPQWKQV